MFTILPTIKSLIHYLSLLDAHSDSCRLTRCVSCGLSNPWRHGTYPRQADRVNPSKTSLNPVPIQRYFCPGCQKTCSALPEVIPPRRWYVWEIQQIAFVLCLTGDSFCAAAKKVLPSRQTISRWVQRFQEQFRLHKDTLCGHCVALGRTGRMTDFWLAAFTVMDLGEAMRLCHLAGVVIP